MTLMLVAPSRGQLIRLLRGGDEFILDVADRDLENVPGLVDTRPVNSGGRGLALALSLDGGRYAAETTKHVWASFAAQP
jgi:serine/threonine-protein kinase RsbW